MTHTAQYIILIVGAALWLVGFSGAAHFDIAGVATWFAITYGALTLRVRHQRKHKANNA